jgi:hypothetical protein
MIGKWLTAHLLAVVAVVAWGGPSRGGDTIRLAGDADAPTQNLVDDGSGADTIPTWYRGFGWGYRGYGWGGYRGFGYGGFYRPYFGWGGFYRPYYGLGFYRPFYGLGLYRPYYGFSLGYGFGYSGFYPGFGFGYGGLFGPWCAGGSASVYSLNIPMATLGTPLDGAPPGGPDPAPKQRPSEEGTFPYDGGPANPVPNPKETTRPSTPPQRSVPLEGRAVSLPRSAAKWTYPAYGETARRAPVESERTYLTRGRK